MALKQNAFYAQSGGVTSVINASACGVIETVNNSSKINKTSPPIIWLFILVLNLILHRFSAPS